MDGEEERIKDIKYFIIANGVEVEIKGFNATEEEREPMKDIEKWKKHCLEGDK